jgi:hypothetical protein
MTVLLYNVPTHRNRKLSMPGLRTNSQAKYFNVVETIRT